MTRTARRSNPMRSWCVATFGRYGDADSTHFVLSSSGCGPRRANRCICCIRTLSSDRRVVYSEDSEEVRGAYCSHVRDYHCLDKYTTTLTDVDIRGADAPDVRSSGPRTPPALASLTAGPTRMRSSYQTPRVSSAHSKVVSYRLPPVHVTIPLEGSRRALPGNCALRQLARLAHCFSGLRISSVKLRMMARKPEY